MKKFLSVIMAVALLTAVIPLGTFTASAETVSGSCGDNVIWEYDTETATLTISGTGEIYDCYYYIYSSGGVKKIVTGAPWGSYCDIIKKIIIHSGVTSIGCGAFAGCTGLTFITIPKSVTSIGDYAFSGCTGLTSVTIPDSVTSIGDSVFAGCSSLQEITLPFVGDKRHKSTDTCQYPLGYIFGTTFYTGGTATTQYYYGSSNSSITSNKYYIPPSLKEVIITDCDYIQYGAFYGCTGLTSITIPDSVTSIGSSAFAGCTGLTQVNYTGNIADWCKISFSGSVSNPLYYAHNLYVNDKLVTDLIIPDSVTSIGGYAFSGCTGLTSVTIPDSVTSIGGYAFSGCTGLTSIIVDSGNIVYYSTGNCIIETESKTLVAGCKNSIIPNDSSVTSIGNSAFYGCTGLTSITIPDSVTSIGSSVFAGCTGLTSITIPDSVTSIGNSAFSGCTGLTSVTIPDSVTSIGGSTFYGCTGLTSITIPDSVTSIGSSAFYGCTGLTSITIPDSVTSIGGYAFSGCTGLTSVTIPDSVTSIGGSTFYGCTGLTSIAIPDSVTSIGGWAFDGCTGLTSITIPDSVTSIDKWAFSGCTGLTSITILGSVTSIGTSAIPKSTSIICCKGSEAENYAKQNGNAYIIIEIDGNGDCGKNSYYFIERGRLHINGTGETDSWKTQGGVPWYDLAAQIKEVIIDEGITKIGTYAFYCLDNLESVICKNKDLEFGRYALNTANENLTVYAQNGALTEYCQNSNIKFADVTPAPELDGFTANSITVKTVSGYEYSKDTVNWQTSGVFRGLSPVAEYNIYARLIKTKDEFPGKISEPLTVTTDKANVSAPPKPVCIRNTDTEITLKANGLYEYSIDGENWQKSNVFTGLIHRNTYSLYQRVAETETEYASVPSAPLIMQLVKKTVSAPAAPDYQSHTDNSITLAPNELYEFSIDGENWQKSNVFAGLSKNVIYRFYQRAAETDTEYASEPSKPLVIAIPDKPEILEVGFENILVKYVKGFEYCLDDFVWQDSNTFNKLIDNTEYYVYQRMAAIAGEKVYQITSDYTAVTTDNSIVHTHTFGEWSVKTEPTCTGTGEEIRICADCGYIETRDINAHGHLHTEIRNAVIATCTENGYTGDTYCLNCGEKVATGENISALGHKYSAATTPPTCTEQGYTTYTCENCGDSYIDGYVNATGHTVGEWVTDTEKHWHICSACGEKLDEESHTESDWITDSEALPGVAGLRHKECTVCGYITETETIPALAAYKPGDINNDGEVDNKDLTRLFQHLSNWDVTVNEAALDVNGDDSVDNKDLTRLFQYLSNWEVEIF